MKMTEKERIQGEIKILEKKLWFLEEIEEHKDQEMRKAFKDDYGYAPYRNELSWVGFQKGWEASQKNQNNIEEIIDNPTTMEDYKVGEYEPTSPEPEENEWRTVALCFGEKLSAIGPCGYYGMTADEWLEWVNGTYEKNADELLPLVNRGVMKNKVKEYQSTPPEPTSTAFRQKLFDGIKSVFYDPDYERTHWKMKVNMAVDEVLTHFYDIIPEPQEPICDEFVKGWNCCLVEIKACMEHTDD